MTDPTWDFIETWEKLRKAPDPSRSRAYWHLSPVLAEIGPERLRTAATRFYREQEGVESKYVPQLTTWLRERLWEPLLSEGWRPPYEHKTRNTSGPDCQNPLPMEEARKLFRNRKQAFPVEPLLDEGRVAEVKARKNGAGFKKLDPDRGEASGALKR